MDDFRSIIDRINPDPNALDKNIQTLIDNANIIRQSPTEYPELKDRLLVCMEERLAEMHKSKMEKEDKRNYMQELKEFGIHEYYINQVHKI